MSKTEQISYRALIRIYKGFGRYYKKHWRLLAAAFAGSLLTSLVALLLPWPLKLILDYVILQNPLPQKAAFLSRWTGNDPNLLLIALVLSFIGIQVLDSLASYLHKVGMLSAGEKIVTDIREGIFAHLQRLSMSFHESARSGDLVYRLSSDVTGLRTILIEVPQNFAYRIVMIFSHVGLMMVLEWRLALIAASVIPVLYYFNHRIGRELLRAVEKKRTKESDVSSIIAENATAMALVQAYGREDLQQARFELENRESLESGIDATRLSKIFNRVTDMLVALGTWGVICYGGSLVLDSRISPGTGTPCRASSASRPRTSSSPRGCTGSRGSRPSPASSTTPTSPAAVRLRTPRSSPTTPTPSSARTRATRWTPGTA